MNLNVLIDFPYTKRYYLLHPWKWFKHLFINIKDFWLRGTKGYTYSDVWNFDSWFCSVVPPMLRHMAEYGSAYPGVEPFGTPEEWHTWLNKMADDIEHIQCDIWYDINNEYAKEYHQSFEDEFYEKEHPNVTVTFSNTMPRDEVRKLYYEKSKELNKSRQAALNAVFKEFSTHFDCLWD